jgi:hypothetical protein
MVNTTVKLTTDVNRYSYKAYDLFVPYALSNLFALVCVGLGLTSYIHDRAMPGKKMQDIVQAARNPKFQDSPSLGSRTTSLGANVGPDGAVELGLAIVAPGEGSNDGRTRSFRSIRWSSDAGRVEGRELV